MPLTPPSGRDLDELLLRFQQLDKENTQHAARLESLERAYAEQCSMQTIVALITTAIKLRVDSAATRSSIVSTQALALTKPTPSNPMLLSALTDGLEIAKGSALHIEKELDSSLAKLVQIFKDKLNHCIEESARITSSARDKEKKLQGLHTVLNALNALRFPKDLPEQYGELEKIKLLPLKNELAAVKTRIREQIGSLKATPVMDDKKTTERGYLQQSHRPHAAGIDFFSKTSAKLPAASIKKLHGDLDDMIKDSNRFAEALLTYCIDKPFKSEGEIDVYADFNTCFTSIKSEINSFKEKEQPTKDDLVELQNRVNITISHYKETAKVYPIKTHFITNLINDFFKAINNALRFFSMSLTDYSQHRKDQADAKQFVHSKAKRDEVIDQFKEDIDAALTGLTGAVGYDPTLYETPASPSRG